MKTLKVQIESLSEEWDIEVKQNNTTLHMIIICSKWKGRRSDPKTWAAQPLDDAFSRRCTNGFTTLPKSHIRQNKLQLMTELVLRSIMLMQLTHINWIIRNFEAHTNEYLLVEKLLNFCVKQTHEDAQISSLNDRWKGSVQSI